MSSTVTVVVAGVFVGGALSLIAGRLAQPVLFETNPSDLSARAGFPPCCDME
jgi:hypothetical protein